MVERVIILALQLCNIDEVKNGVFHSLVLIQIAALGLEWSINSTRSNAYFATAAFKLAYRIYHITLCHHSMFRQ